MAQFEPVADEIRNMGAQVVFIAAEKRDGMHKPVKFLATHPISFPFLLDEDRSATKAYGLYHRVGLDAINIAHPATLVIDRGGLVRYVYRGSNQFDRAPMEQVLEAAGKLHD
jgi:peroxiredoxin